MLTFLNEIKRGLEILFKIKCWSKHSRYLCYKSGFEWEWSGLVGLVWWCLIPLSTIFQLYRGSQFYCWRKPGENQWPVTSHWETLSHNVVHLALIKIRTHNISGDRHWLHRHSCKSNYHTIMAMTAPRMIRKCLNWPN